MDVVGQFDDELVCTPGGWPKGRHGPVPRRSVDEVVFRNRWDPERADLVYGVGATGARTLK